MRKPRYLSPTSIDTFYKDTDEFYLRYLADERPPRPPQTKPMSVGSAFDAYVKSYLYETLFGKVTDEFDLVPLFEAQVEEHNRDFAWEAGKNCFDQYKEHGALADLMLELEQATEDPRFEFTIEGRVAHETSTSEGVTFLGKPDVYFRTKGGNAVVYDWKVNGYCSNSHTSPAKGYICLRPGGKVHKLAQPMKINGLMINGGMTLDQVNVSWANQTSIYAWLLGEEIGGDFVVGIDQLACNNGDIKIAKHRCCVNKDHQFELYAKAVYIWQVIESGHIFRDLDEEGSLCKQEMLDKVHEAYKSDGTPNEDWFQTMTRKY